MKKVIELLDEALEKVSKISTNPNSYFAYDFQKTAMGLMSKAITELKAKPCWYTPAQWEEKTGKPWPENWAVYIIMEANPGQRVVEIKSLRVAKAELDKQNTGAVMGIRWIVCAAEAGPPDGWRPEDSKSDMTNPKYFEDSPGQPY
jgi:hypothetical protein